jgi:hypothetical protein
VLDLQQEVRVGGARLREVEHGGGRHERGRRDLRDVLAVLAGHPVDRRVEVGAGVLAGGDVVPVPGRAALVIAAELGQRERRRVGERLGQPQDGGGRVQRRGQVDDLDAAGAQRVEQGRQDGGHRESIAEPARSGQ